MGYVYFFIAILIIGAFIEYPVISIAITIGLIAVIVYITKNSESKGFEESKTTIDLAVSYIEEAYDIAKKHSYIEPGILTMYIDEDANHSRRGFQIVLYTHESYTTSAKHAINDHFGWQVHLDEDNCVYLEKNKYDGIKCSWNKFNAEVWNTIKRKHPTWNVNYVRDNKSVINCSNLS